MSARETNPSLCLAQAKVDCSETLQAHVHSAEGRFGSWLCEPFRGSLERKIDSNELSLAHE
jgi:hypothetical protein